MPLFNITIEKVIVKNDNDEIIKLLKEIRCLLTDDAEGEVLRKLILDKLNTMKTDIEGTIS